MLALACLTRNASPQTAEPQPRPERGILARARLDPSKDIAFQAAVVPETVYVGQQATYQVGVFLSDEIRVRLRRNPEFVPPEVRSMLAFDLPAPLSGSSRTVGARHYDVHVFQRALFPLTPGRQVIPSARLNYALPLSNSFFAREESHSEHTGALQIVAREPPVEGRPGEYRGAVGRLTASGRADMQHARVGDPLTYTISVRGTGNVTMLPRPDLSIPWADVVPGDERVELDTTAELLRGHKDFEWVVTPRKSGSVTMPAIRYPFFNPYTERYEIAVTSPETLTVAPGNIAPSARVASDSVAALPIRRAYRGVEPEPLTSSRAYWLVLALAPVPSLALASRRRPRRARTKLPTHARTLRAFSTATNVDPAQLRRAYAAAIAERVKASAATLSNHAELVRTLRRVGVSPETAQRADALLGELDAVVFGHIGTMPPDAARRAHDLVQAIDGEAKARRDILVRVAGMSALLLVAVSLGIAQVSVNTEARAFAEGVRQYDDRQFDLARSTFFDLAQARPRAADAWANFGTSSWQAHDTAAAVIGWQRAARLQPMAGDVRQKLSFTPGFRGGPLGDIPPASLTVIGGVGGAIWILAWILIGLSTRRSVGRVSRVGAAFVVAACAIAVAGMQQRDTLDGRRAAVVVSRSRLRAAPALAEEAGAETITGEVGRVIGRQGVWARLRLADGRDGWLESRRLEFLGVE